jgi:hypothetical protein
MTHRTLLLSTFEAYVASESDSAEDQADEGRNRAVCLKRFPYSVMLELAYPELDFIERWCWQQCGPMDGECLQRQSRYRVCRDDAVHSHVGTWMSHFLVKTDYDFGYCEFYFAKPGDRDAFLAEIPNFNWGEDFAK